MSANEASSQRLNSTPYKAYNVLSEVCVCETDGIKYSNPKPRAKEWTENTSLISCLHAKWRMVSFPLQV